MEIRPALFCVEEYVDEIKRESMRRIAGVLCILSVLSLLAAPTVAQPRERSVLSLLVSPPPAEDETVDRTARMRVIRDMTADRLQKRLVAAGVQQLRLDRSQPGRITVETRSAAEREWLAALLTAPGRVALQPLTRQPDWSELISLLPEGVHLADDEVYGGLYLQSTDRERLEGVLERVTLPNLTLATWPHEPGGWRSIGLSPGALFEEDIETVERRRTPTGEHYVWVTLTARGLDRLAVYEAEDVQRWALSIDGEVVGLISARGPLVGRFAIEPPRRLVSQKQRSRWAADVAGRMAAPLPIALAVEE